MANFRRNIAILSEAYNSKSDEDEDCTFTKSVNRDDKLEEASCFSGDEDRFNEDLSMEFAMEDIQNLAASGPEQSRQSSNHYKTKALNPLPRENVSHL